MMRELKRVEVLKEKLLLEEPQDDIELVVPEEAPIEEPVENNDVPQEVVDNAYSNLISNTISREWEDINSYKDLVAQFVSEQKYPEVVDILNQLIDDKTISVGMLTKALELINGTEQNDLMQQGIDKANEVINNDTKEKVVDESLKEDAIDNQFDDGDENAFGYELYIQGNLLHEENDYGCEADALYDAIQEIENYEWDSDYKGDKSLNQFSIRLMDGDTETSFYNYEEAKKICNEIFGESLKDLKEGIDLETLKSLLTSYKNNEFELDELHIDDDGWVANSKTSYALEESRKLKETNLAKTRLKKGDRVKLDKDINKNIKDPSLLDDEWEVVGFYNSGLKDDDTVKDEFIDLNGVRIKNLKSGKYADVNRFQLTSVDESLKEGMKPTIYNVLGWLGNHRQAWQDFKSYFKWGEKGSKTPSLDEIKGWISDHKELTTDYENFFDDKINESLKEGLHGTITLITPPEEYQQKLEQEMAKIGWELDDETSWYGSKKFYRSLWADNDGEGQDIHYQFITKDKYDADQWDALMDTTFDLLDGLEKDFDTRITFSAGLGKDDRGTIGVDLRAIEVDNDSEPETKPKERAGHKVRLKDGSPADDASKKVIDDIKNHGFDVSQMGVKKDESLKEDKSSENWKLNYLKRLETELDNIDKELSEPHSDGRDEYLNDQKDYIIDRIEKLKDDLSKEGNYNLSQQDRQRLIKWWKDLKTYFYYDGNPNGYEIVTTNDEPLDQSLEKILTSDEDCDDWFIAMFDVFSDLKDELENPQNVTDPKNVKRLLNTGKQLYNKYALVTI